MQPEGRCFVTHPHVQSREQAAGIGAHSYDVLAPPSGVGIPGARATHTLPPAQVWGPQGTPAQSRQASPESFHVCVAPSHTTVGAQHGSTRSHEVCPAVHGSPMRGEATHAPVSAAASRGLPASELAGTLTVPPHARRNTSEIQARFMRY